MESSPLYLEILRDIGIPILTLIGGWFAHMFRTKQKKESDILDNVKQILEMQKSYIEEQASTIKETKDMNKRLERKLDKKDRSIRKANGCRFTNEGEGCPVLNQEDKGEYDKCDGCEYNKKEVEGAYDKSED